eukprot:TRINITY_DN8695_c0_g1_i6.p1 TRINITY_DN8695_c0_g1~~TRINITY_DN8695_c0_g1_i6.p1  ORF type:complete len:165 (-),score=34.78 TRINITY_DN8695_c0_g1_i6:756-1250(-)
MIRRPPRSTLSSSSAASDVYKRQVSTQSTGCFFDACVPEMRHPKGSEGRLCESLTDAIIGDSLRIHSIDHHRQHSRDALAAADPEEALMTRQIAQAQARAGRALAACQRRKHLPTVPEHIPRSSVQSSLKSPSPSSSAQRDLTMMRALHIGRTRLAGVLFPMDW